MQLLARAEPAVEFESAGHPVQIAAPASGLKLPAKHAVHGPPSAPVKPGLHWQADCVVLASNEREFGVQ